MVDSVNPDECVDIQHDRRRSECDRLTVKHVFDLVAVGVWEVIHEFRDCHLIITCYEYRTIPDSCGKSAMNTLVTHKGIQRLTRVADGGILHSIAHPIIQSQQTHGSELP